MCAAPCSAHDLSQGHKDSRACAAHLRTSLAPAHWPGAWAPSTGGPGGDSRGTWPPTAGRCSSQPCSPGTPVASVWTALRWQELTRSMTPSRAADQRGVGLRYSMMPPRQCNTSTPQHMCQANCSQLQPGQHRKSIGSLCSTTTARPRQAGCARDGRCLPGGHITEGSLAQLLVQEGQQAGGL